MILIDIPDNHNLIESILNWDEWLYMIIIPGIITFLITFIVGLERQNVGKAAGISAHVLVGLSSMMIAVIQRFMFFQQFGVGIADPEGQRIIAQVVSGVGFIGAGVIMKDRGNVIRGITTAATLWFSAVLGLILGSGYIYEGLAFGLFVVIFITLRDLKRGFNPLKPRVKQVRKIESVTNEENNKEKVKNNDF